MPANGPAIRGVCVAERTEAVGRKSATGQSPGTAVVERSMARFLESWYRFSGLYECRGTNILSDWYLVTLQMLYKWEVVQCRGTN